MIHPASILSNTTISNIDDDCIQQNAVDLRVKSIRRILPTMFILDEERKVHRDTIEVGLDEDGYWNLEPGSYEFTTAHIIQVGEDEAGFVITRSTLNRNGVFVTSGNYDSGYHGAQAGCLHVTSGPMKLKPGTRIGQMLIWKAQAIKQYDGDYGLDEQGKPKAMEAKYHE